MIYYLQTPLPLQEGVRYFLPLDAEIFLIYKLTLFLFELMALIIATNNRYIDVKLGQEYISSAQQR